MTTTALRGCIVRDQTILCLNYIQRTMLTVPRLLCDRRLFLCNCLVYIFHSGWYRDCDFSEQLFCRGNHFAWWVTEKEPIISAGSRNLWGKTIIVVSMWHLYHRHSGHKHTAARLQHSSSCRREAYILRWGCYIAQHIKLCTSHYYYHQGFHF